MPVYSRQLKGMNLWHFYLQTNVVSRKKDYSVINSFEVGDEKLICGSQGKGRLERGTESFLEDGDVLCLSWHGCHT